MTLPKTKPEAVSASGLLRKRLVWDPVVRIFHWTVVGGCLLDFFVFDDGKIWHRYIGYAVAVALAVRLIWGLIGTRYARFEDFVPSPSALAAYAAAFLRGEEPRFLGHNPLGAVMILTLMTLLAGVSVTGWMLTLDAYFGNEPLEEFHEMLANSILILALLHAAAALFVGRRHGENLVASMITGYKRV